jgi:hypothetical protein
MPATARPTHSHSHAGGQAGTKRSTTRATPERTLLYQTIAEHFETLNLPAPASSTARATTTAPGPMSARPFANTSNAASLPTALPEPGATIVGTTTLVAYSAKVGVSAPRATHGAWWRRRRTSPTTSSPVCRCANGCSLCRSDCAILCSATGQCSTWCCASSCGSFRKPCRPTAPVRHNVDKATLHIGAVAFIHRFGSSLNATCALPCLCGRWRV